MILPKKTRQGDVRRKTQHLLSFLPEDPRPPLGYIVRVENMEAQHIHHPNVVVVADDPAELRAIEAALDVHITPIIPAVSRQLQARPVSAGHAMFLRMSGESGKEELRFLVKGFQNFFAASCVAAEGAENLPELKELLTDNWWQQMLEMLGEAWPLNYVEIVQNRLGAFKSTSKDNFLHIAARSGHRPIFQLLHRFSESHKDTGERLAVHIAMRNGHFQTAAFLNERWLEQYGSAKTYERRSRKAPFWRVIVVVVVLPYPHLYQASYSVSSSLASPAS
eukprot:s1219_g13.t1